MSEKGKEHIFTEVSTTTMNKQTILIAGATGNVGGRRLVLAGETRCQGGPPGTETQDAGGPGRRHPNGPVRGGNHSPALGRGMAGRGLYRHGRREASRRGGPGALPQDRWHVPLRCHAGPRRTADPPERS